MPAPILLNDYRMKKYKRKHPAKASEILVDVEYMDIFKAEVRSRLIHVDAKLNHHDKRFDTIDKRFDELEAKMDKFMDEMREMFHQTKLLMEEQNKRNMQAYDGYLVVYEKVHALEARIKPECLD